MAAIIAGGSTYLVSRRLRPATAGPQLVTIVAAAKDLSPGVPLTVEDLTTIGWPNSVALEGSLTKVEDAVGRPLRVSVAANQPLLQRHLAAAGAGFGLSGKIPPGMRATAVRSNEIVGVAGFLYPGSHVDVVVAYQIPASAGNPQPATQTVLQNVEVLTTGTAVEPDPTGRPQTVSVVTLLLNPEDSQKLLLASAQGTIQFVLRSGVDQEKLTLPPTRLEQLYASAAPRPEPKPVAPPRPAPRPRVEPPPPAPVVMAPPPPPPHQIEVIKGTERSVQKF